MKSTGPEFLVPSVVLLSAMVLFLSLGQGTLYGDGPGILLEVQQDRAFENTVHYLHGPILLALSWLISPDFSLYQAAILESSIGAAVGVLGVYLASQKLLRDWRRAALIAALVATCPGVLFYATVVELHGLFFAFFGLVALGLANMVLQPTNVNAVKLGLLMGLAALAHQTAHLLPAVVFVLCPVLASEHGKDVGLRRWLVLLAIAVLVHAVFAGSALGLLRLFDIASASMGFAAEIVVENIRAHSNRLADSPAVFLREWVVPFFPTSIACIVTIANVRARPMLVALYALVVLYVLLTTILVGGTEFGAYLLPLAWPAALLAVRAFQTRWLVVLSVLGLCIAMPRLHAHDTIDHTRRTAASLKELQDEESLYFLAVTKKDLDLYFVGLPRAGFYYLPVLGQLDEKTVRAHLPRLDKKLEEELVKGRTVFMSKEGNEFLLSDAVAAHTSGAAVLAAHLAEAYVVTPIHRREFKGWSLARRPK